MTSAGPDLSIIIVNYNVKEYLASLLLSVRAARHHLDLEILVVDNASTDGSQEFLTTRFPEITFIANAENVGFGKANNQAIRIARGRHTLLLNPDTLLQEDTLVTLAACLDADPSIAAAGCRLLNPDGSFAPESKRTVPTPTSALYRVLGLNRLFPRSRRFNSYYMGWVDEHQEADVPVLSGAFMYCRTDVLRQLDGFDERFFMYGEDIDLCFRMVQAGYRIRYVPATTIIHYKGESTKKDHIDYVILFNKAMYQFFDKHYRNRYAGWFKALVRMGIVVRATLSYLVGRLKAAALPLADLFLLNGILLVLFASRYGIPTAELTDRYQPGFLIMHGLTSVLFLVAATWAGVYTQPRTTTPRLLRAIALTFASVAFITFFLRDYAFSRWIILNGALAAAVALPLWRRIPGVLKRTPADRKERVLLVGLTDRSEALLQHLRQAPHPVEPVGWIVQDGEPWTDRFAGLPVIGRPIHTADLVRFHEVDQLVFDGKVIPTGVLLSILTQIRNPNVGYRLIPESMDFLIGKSKVEYLDELPLVEVDVPYANPFNRLVKRLTDLVLVTPVLLVGWPLWLWAEWRLRHAAVTSVGVGSGGRGRVVLRLRMPYADHRFSNRFRLLLRVWTGALSLVGAPLMPERGATPVYYTPGITGLRQLHEAHTASPQDLEALERQYVQGYSWWLDLRILLTAVRKRAFGDRYF